MKVFLKVGKVAREVRWGQRRKDSSFRDAGVGLSAKGTGRRLGGDLGCAVGKPGDSPPPGESDTMRLDKGECRRSQGPRDSKALTMHGSSRFNFFCLS